jgi:small-conductance mechanosensitive channel
MHGHMPEWFTDLPDEAIRIPASLLGLLLLGLLLRWVLFKVIDRTARRAENGGRAGRPLARRAQRANALAGLFKSIVTGVLVAVVGTMMLSEVGINIAPIIAGAGIIGIALGFGAQSLVKDFLSGVFMILEDQFGVGDVVDVGEAIGTIEHVTLRVTRLRAIDGTVWYVPNGEIMRVGNMSQNWARAVLDIQVAYTEDLVHVKRVLQEVAHDMWEDDDYKGEIIEEPEVWGVEMLDADGVTVRVALKTAPLENWKIAREMRQRIKARFDHEGIEIPFPQRVVWHREERGPETSVETSGE